MKVKLIKQYFEGNVGYKIYQIKWCCSKLKESPSVQLRKSENDELPVMFIESVDCCDEYLRTEITYCPFCGEKIEIAVIREEDVTETYTRLMKHLRSVFKDSMQATDKRLVNKLQRILNDLNRQINSFHEICDY